MASPLMYDEFTAPLRLEVRMPSAEVVDTMLYDGCETWTPNAAHLAKLRKTHHRIIFRCIGWQRKRDDYHYAGDLAKTCCESAETTVRTWMMCFWGSWLVWVTSDERLPRSYPEDFLSIYGDCAHPAHSQRTAMGCGQQTSSRRTSHVRSTTRSSEGSGVHHGGITIGDILQWCVRR